MEKYHKHGWVLLALVTGFTSGFPAALSQPQLTYKGKVVGPAFHRAIDLRRRATPLLKQEKYEEACVLLAQAAAAAPEFSEVRAELGSALLKLERPEQAIPHLQAAVDDNINSEAVWLNLAVAYSKIEKNDDALLIYQCFLKRFPASDQRQNVLEQESQLKQLVTAAPPVPAPKSHVQQRHKEGVAAMEKRDYAKAIECFLEVVKAKPESESARTNLALCLSGSALELEQRKQFEDAEDAYKQMMDLRKTLAKPSILDSSVRNYAAMLREQGKPVQAAEIENQLKGSNK